MKIHVRQEHINKGTVADADNCAFSLACKEQTGLKTSAYRIVFIRQGSPIWKHICILNDLDFEWIQAFDYDKTSVQPTVIDVPGLEDYVHPKVAELVLEQRPSLPQIKEEAIV